MKNIQILIVDYGSQYTLVIGRTLRELGIRSIILREADKTVADILNIYGINLYLINI